jgi:cell division protein FtsB
MDGECSKSGLGSLTWYWLGRSAADAENAQTNAVNTVSRNRRWSADLQTLAARNRTLAAENAQLRQELADYELNYNNLKQWADDASKRLKAYRSNEQG